MAIAIWKSPMCYQYVFFQEYTMKKKLTLVRKGRTRALFNTGTRPHKSMKDYNRKVKHKQGVTENVE